MILRARARHIRDRLAGIYLAESLTILVGVGTAAFGSILISLPEPIRKTPSFRATFAMLPVHVWGLGAVLLGVLMVTLLLHSRAAAAIPALLTAAGTALWAVPIIFTPGSIPTAPVVYIFAALVALLAGVACLVPREHRV